MSKTKDIAVQIWERLNPFQSAARIGSMRNETIFAKPDEKRQLPETETAGHQAWCIIEQDQKPERFMQNDVMTTHTAIEQNWIAYSAPVQRPVSSKRAIQIKPLALSDDRFQVLQKWEGTVLDLDNGILYARLSDLTQDNPDEEVEIELEEILPDDRALVQPGASFYWSIGYLHKSHGQRIRASDIRFRRIPGWTQCDIEGAKKQSQMDGTFYNLDCGKSSA